MTENKPQLTVIDGETLMDTRLEPTKFCIDTLLPQGITILGGAPKIGKSWWVLDICIRIAKGESVWGMPTTKGTTLYLCLEDTLRRVQERLCLITDDVPSNAFFATAAHTLAEGLCDEIRQRFQTEMETSSAELTENINRLITDTEKQVGRMSESCSNNISMLRSTAEDKLDRHTNKLFWMSLIPSAVLIVLELMRHILSAISAI